MTQRTWCSECDYLLYEGDVLKGPSDIIEKYNGRCPSCNKKLEFTSDSVKIYRDFDPNKEDIPNKVLRRNSERVKAGSMEAYDNMVEKFVRWRNRNNDNPENS